MWFVMAVILAEIMLLIGLKFVQYLLHQARFITDTSARQEVLSLVVAEEGEED